MTYNSLFSLIICWFCLLPHLTGQSCDEDLFIAFDTTIYKDHIAATIILDELAKLPPAVDCDGGLLRRRAILARIVGNYPEALSLNLKAVEYYETLGDLQGQAEVYHNMGYLMRQLADYDQSVEYYTEAIRLRHNTGDSTALAISHREIGVIYRMNDQIDSAMYHYSKAAELFDPVDDVDEVLTLKGNYAMLYQIQKDYDKAIAMNKSMLSAVKARGKVSSISTRYSNIAKAYFRKRQVDSAAIYIDSALSVSLENKLLPRVSMNLLLKARIQYRAREYKSAYQTIRKHKRLSDSLNRQTTSETIDNQLRVFDYERQLLQDSIATERLAHQVVVEQSRKSKILWISLLVITILVSLIAYQVNRLKMAKLKTENEQKTATLLQSKLKATKQENERLIEHSQLQLDFKKSIADKVDEIVTTDRGKSRDIRALQHLLLNQLRVDTQTDVENRSINQMPTSYDDLLRSRYPDLTASERKLCFLVRNGLTIKEIAAIRQTSSPAVQAMRYRIRKKLGLRKGEELKSYLLSID